MDSPGTELENITFEFTGLPDLSHNQTFVNLFPK